MWPRSRALLRGVLHSGGYRLPKSPHTRDGDPIALHDCSCIIKTLDMMLVFARLQFHVEKAGIVRSGSSSLSSDWATREQGDT